MAKGGGKFEYEAQEPAFLRRMRGEVAGNGLDGRHERPVARPRRAKTNDEDDEPTYVDEASNDTLTKAEYEALVKESEPQDTVAASVDDANKKPDHSGAPKVSQAEAQVGQTQRKRKALKIGADEGDSGDDNKSPPNPTTKQKKKPAKKAKKVVALSFGDET